MSRRDGYRDPIDEWIGRRIRERRRELFISTRGLATAVRMSNGTIDLWERGLQPPRGSDIVALAAVLDVPIPYFFEGLRERRMTAAALHRFKSVDFMPENHGEDPLEREEARRLACAFLALPSRQIQWDVLALVEGMAVVPDRPIEEAEEDEEPCPEQSAL